MGSANPAFAAKDRTGAERQRRFRERRRHSERRKLQSAAVTRTTSKPAAQTVTPLRSHRRRGIIPWIMAGAALAVAAVSGSFSIVGLTAIFAGAFWPVIGMGAALECAKLSAVAWRGRGYRASRWLKGAIVTLVVTLMGLNAIGCYGYLARAHLDHAVAGEAVIAGHAAQVTARREVAAAAVADLDRRIEQVDAAVTESTRRGRTVSAMTLAEHQAGRRDQLVAQRTQAANTLAAVEVEDRGIDSERSQLAADFGPVEYLSKLIGADREAVMRWFVLFVAVLLDPLAITLLWAANTRE